MAVTSEAERQYFLGVAGIRMWYPKQPLSGAAASVALDFSEPLNEAGTEPVGPAAMAAPVAPAVPGRTPRSERNREKLSGMRQLVAEAPGQKEVDAASAKAPPEAPSEAVAVSAPEASAGPEEPVRLSLGIWESEGFVLLSGLSADASQALQNQLAANILLALRQSEVTASALRWPVFSHPDVPGNDNAGLVRVLAPWRERWQNRSVIAVGVLPERSGSEADDWYASAFGPLLLEYPFSLAALGADASRKKALWQQLQKAVR